MLSLDTVNVSAFFFPLMELNGVSIKMLELGEKKSLVKGFIQINRFFYIYFFFGDETKSRIY